MTLKRPLWMQAGGADPTFDYSALDARALLSAVFNQPGVINTSSTALKVSQRGAGANFSVDVAAGLAVVAGGDVSNQGMYLVQSTAVENVTVPSPPGAGTRTHRVVAQVRDELHNGAYSTYDWVPQVLEDTGSGTPATPNSALSLATVSVTAGQVSVTDAHITDGRRNAIVGNGMTTGRYIGADADRPPSPWDGELIWRTDKSCYELALSGSWYEIPRRDGGGSAWSTYTPTWTATVNPSINLGTRPGRYVRYGRTVHVSGKIIGGSNTSWGSGQYVVGLPVQAYEADDGQVLQMQVRDVSTGQLYAGQARILSGGLTASLWAQGPNEDLDAFAQGSLFTLATGDYIRWWGTYEAAS